MKRQKNGLWKLTDAEMNKLALFAQKGAITMKREGHPLMAEEAEKMSKVIYDILKDAGYFN